MGDCTYPSHIKEITDVYGKLKCESTSYNEYFTIKKLLNKNKELYYRKYKINKIKNKLSQIKNNI